MDISAYRANNGCFGEQAFWDKCALQEQTNTFCGVGAHHQNVIAKACVNISTV